MSVVARRFTEGSSRVDEVDVGSLGPDVDDTSLVWVDTDAARETLKDLAERLGLEVVARETEGAPEHAIYFSGDAIDLSVVALGDDSGDPAPVPIRLILGRNIVVSVHDRAIRGLEDPIHVVAEDPRFGRLDAGLFAGLLLDGILHGYHHAIEALEGDIDRIDARALRRERSDELLPSMVDLRLRVAVLRRSLAPQREVFVALTRRYADDPSPIGSPDPELVARLERTIDAVEQARQHLLGSFDIVMTRTGQRTNDIMRALAVISGVMLPASVIAGLMSMNFRPAFFDDPGLYFIVLGLMAALALVTLLLARFRGWV